jgi:hypothetical protein
MVVAAAASESTNRERREMTMQDKLQVGATAERRRG